MISFLLSLFKSFRTFHFAHGYNFEPSRGTKNFWLYTKKKAEAHGGLPGMFSTDSYSTQMLLFIAIFILEGVATVYGYEEGMLWEAVVGCIVIDIFFAIGAHAWQKEICELKNTLLVETQIVEKTRLQERIETCERYSTLLNILIGVSGLVKCLFFYDTYMNIDGVFMGVVACYLIAALLHVYYTGYFLYTSRFNYLIWKEYNKHIASGGTVYAAKHLNILIANNDIDLYATNAGSQRIVKKAQYFFKTQGVLDDTELKRLIAGQLTPAAQAIVAREGSKLQLYWKDYNNHIANGGAPYSKHADILMVNDNVDLTLNTAGNQQIIKSQPQYFFETHGVLEDNELNILIVNQQSPAAQMVVTKEAINLQLKQLTY